MLSPLGNINSIATTPTLVATALPNSIALRVPYDNVAPSVSSAQLDNNASGNRNSLPKTEVPQTVASTASANEKFFLSSLANSTSFSASAQTTFLAQLASGDISPEVRSIFAQYDKLVSYANVKYKPSNAGKPSEPSSLFGAFLKQELYPETDFVAPPPQVELPVASAESVQLPEPQAQPQQPPKEIALPQIQAYSATVARNLDVTTSDVEIA